MVTGGMKDALILCIHIFCSSRKNPYPPYGRSLEIPRGRGVLKVKMLEAKYEAKLEFPGGTGGAKQKTFRGGRWLFSGTAQLCFVFIQH